MAASTTGTMDQFQDHFQRLFGAATSSIEIVDQCQDHFQRLPDGVLLHILCLVEDVRTLMSCRCMNKRLHALVSEIEHPLIKVEGEPPPWSSTLIRVILNGLFSRYASRDQIISAVSKFRPITQFVDIIHFHMMNVISFSLYGKEYPTEVVTYAPPCLGGRYPIVPSIYLNAFQKVETLRVLLPEGENSHVSSIGARPSVLRWRATFGRRLHSCILIAARRYGHMIDDNEDDPWDEDGHKERLLWTTRVLIAASARHRIVREIALGEVGGATLDWLSIDDGDGEGTVLVGRDGLREWREDHGVAEASEGRIGRTIVPASSLLMRHARMLDLGGGLGMERVTMVVVRAVDIADDPAPDDVDDKALVEATFKEPTLLRAAQLLLLGPSYQLFMNGF